LKLLLFVLSTKNNKKTNSALSASRAKRAVNKYLDKL
jgi:hypothetical protein